MSLINKVLRDLDERHADPRTVLLSEMGEHLRPVRERGMSEMFWYTVAVLMIAAIGWVGWVVWQLMPHSVVTDLAYQKQTPEIPKAEAQVGTAPAAPLAVAPSSPAPANPKSPVDIKSMGDVAGAIAPGAQPASPASTPPPAAPKPAASGPPTKVATAAAPLRAAPAESAKFDMLRLATELTTPIPAERTKPRPAAAARKTAQAAAQPAIEQGKIDRRPKDPARERADAEFRRAVQLVNQGRMAEGMDGLRKSLQIDPGYETARQTLVALLLEAKRLDEASAVLQVGVALNPANTGFAMLLARVQVERGDVPGALALLQNHAPADGANADYHGFTAALYQRLGQHEQAVGQYQAALQLVPSVGVWWIGMGISQEALDQPKAALVSFQRAKATGTLAPDLLDFADQRVKLLQ
jgi:MSHA biogenesis protein MshN